MAKATLPLIELYCEACSQGVEHKVYDHIVFEEHSDQTIVHAFRLVTDNLGCECEDENDRNWQFRLTVDQRTSF